MKHWRYEFHKLPNGAHMRQFAYAIAALALFASQALAQTAAPPPLIDAPALIGAPPAAGSADQAADTLAMRPTVSAERIARARADQQFGPWQAMTPVMGENFTEARLPQSARMFERVLHAIEPAIGAAKDFYHRDRPYVADDRVLQCDTPRAGSAPSPAYPSGHAVAGWAWGLVMAELVPTRADALLQRGRDYGESRVVCGFHWPSDIEASRVLAAGVIARLHGDPQFRHDLDAARRELAHAYP
jgi:acid phosphatase (class A)